MAKGSCIPSNTGTAHLNAIGDPRKVMSDLDALYLRRGAVVRSASRPHRFSTKGSAAHKQELDYQP